MKTKDALLKALVENALDFLVRSIADLETSPKFSVINFYSAVELLVKAPLMAEHWSLVVSKRQEPDYKAFLAGNFQSVTLDEAASRLQKVVGNGLTDQELKAFQQVGKHRNKLVHFFHEVTSPKANDELRRAVAKEQLAAWYLLHRLLTTRWEDVFEPWSAKISDVDKMLRKHKSFLQVVFELVQPEIRQRKRQGDKADLCPSCTYRSYTHTPAAEQVYDSSCLVCGLSERCLVVPCKKCGKHLRFVREGYCSCKSCGCTMEPEDIVAALVNNDVADGVDGNCSDCGGYHTVVRMTGTYFCTSCFEFFDELSDCEWCNEPNTGDMEHSYWRGCSHCDGKAGWDRDD